ncbi:MAG: Hpt domain-containing protein [Pseudomonadota bacterium]|nr:Hpt domain-containing protein [Pseudomonadota bacterium]
MLIDLFLADAANYLDEIDTALRTSDWPLLTRAAHTLKGVLATFSACRGEASARLLETAARAEDAVECNKLAAQTRIDVEAFLQAIR